METKLKVAIQKSGRLNEDSLKLLKECGISIDNGKEQLKAPANNFPLEALYLRNSDIPQYVYDGVADIAFVGENVIIEKNKDIEVIEKLGWGKCRLSLAIPKEAEYTGLQWFQDKKIATSYPFTTEKFFKENNLNTEIHVISGSVEIAPNIGLADAICDLVSTGSTLFKNGLHEVQTILKSEAVIVVNKQISSEKRAILDKLIFRINSVLAAKNNKYVLLNAPNENIADIINILPGMKSPTVLPLYDKGWSSIHTVIKESDFWDIIDQLKEKGAQGILIVPIEKMIV